MSQTQNDSMKVFARSVLNKYENIRGKDKNSVGSAFWDIVAITTADEDQKAVFEKQIKDKLSRGELPLQLPFHVISDPPGPKIGNGGSTLTAVQFLHQKYGDKVFTFRVLLIHAGGQSQRMPSASVLGKVFSPIPKGSPIFQMLDIKLAMYLPLVSKMSVGIFVTCADDFLVYDLGEGHSENPDIKFSESGFTVLAHPSPVSIGTTHGVYVIKDPESIDLSVPVQVCKCTEVLQKPSESLMKEKGAILNRKDKSVSNAVKDAERFAYTDSSFFFGHDVTKNLLGFLKENGMVMCEIDAYGDFLQALGPSATSSYVHNISNVSVVTPDLIETRTKVFNLLQGSSISVLVMNQSKFVHIGTVMEYINHFCNDHTFQEELGLGMDVFNLWTDLPASPTVSGEGDEPDRKRAKVIFQSDTALGCVMHSVMPHMSNIQANTVVEYCHFGVAVNIGQYSIVSNCEYDGAISESLTIPSNTFLHTVPINIEDSTKYVTVFFDIKDNLKKAAPNNDLKNLPFLGKLVENYAAVIDKDLSSLETSNIEKTTGKVNLWHSCLFPVSDTMSESLKLALKCLKAVKTDNKAMVSLKSTQTLSMHLILQLKDVDAMLNQRNRIYTLITDAQHTISTRQ